MKRILIFTLTLTLVLNIFIFPANAADNVNYNIEIENTAKAPVIDGKIGIDEYGLFPVHRFSESKSQFDYTTNNEFDDWDFEFFATWDINNLYLAWKVESEKHAVVPIPQLDLMDGVYYTREDLLQESVGYFWMFSGIQISILPGEPIAGESDYATNHLNMGFCQVDDGSTGKAIWNYPIGVTTDNIEGWEAICTRDEDKQITVYEIAIPWKLTGVPVIGDGAKFGLSYAVFAQEHITLGKAGIQWQTGCFYQEDINKAGVITLKGKIVDPFPPCPAIGRVPIELRDKEQLCIPKFNSHITGEDATLITDIYGDMSNSDEGYNLIYTLSWALKPIENDLYEITEVISNTGSTPEFKTLEDGSIIIAFHSDGEGLGKELLKQAKQYKVGTQIGLWGFNIEKNEQTYTNSFAYIEKAVTDTETPPDDTSSDNTPNDDTSSIDTSNEVSPPVSSAPSDTVSKNGPTDKSPVSENEAASNTESVAKESEEPSSPIVPIVLSVIGVAIVAAVVIIVIKKRK